MHELSIAEALVDIVQRHARGRAVTEVEVQVGALRQVVPAALAFAFELVARETVAQDARLVLHEVAAAGRCAACGTEQELDGLPLTCRACGGWELRITRGEELRVEALVCDEAPLLPSTGGMW